ncbi:putative baseplate assembly protein [Amycolatopsis nigrescens]|uniref:putative baseplate assembly protein n=1 Tax=Amycolatopsis nigrescens TaxID=381445 RepID=UPI0003799A47|nr:putative baseplate assembly protein [Amycolatopsis nigrescens]
MTRTVPPQDCGTELRRARVRATEHNGVDYVEADDAGTVLTVAFLGRAPGRLGPANIRIDGGRRITGIHAVELTTEVAEDPELDDLVHVTVNTAGDRSVYTLSIVEEDGSGRPGDAPYRGFDPRYASAEFSFTTACPSGTDCAETDVCPPPAHPAPVIDYTARDYASLRRALLDRMTLTVPAWAERHAPDLGVTLAEVLAYTGDQLSYQQDAVAAEAYLDTARHRVSIRRHVRLVDYAMHDGCNARTWVALRADRKVTLSEGDFRFAAVDLGMLDPRDRPELGTVISDEQLAGLPPAAAVEVFEPLVPGPLTIRPAHNRIRFWTWGEQECGLPSGATSATLMDDWSWHGESEEAEPAHDGPKRRALRLRPGDVLVIEEVLGPRTGAAADADPRHRQAVRLTSVRPGVDRLYGQPVLEVDWAAEDALTFPVCISARGGPDCELLADVSVATGNVLLADHGRDITYCGGSAEEVRTPPAETPPSTCEPPAFGCPDRATAAPAVELIHALLAAARAGTPLSGDDLAGLVPLLGQSTVDRAGVLPDAPAAEQAAALEALLAQISYPAVRSKFRPRLRQAPVTQCAVFPEPARVAAAQARLLAGIPVAARARVAELWRRVRAGDRLSRDERGELSVLFGARVLDELELDEHPRSALRELSVRFDQLLRGKLRRLGTLLARAGGGGVLDEGTVWELGQSWGAGYAAGLGAGDPRLAGPASAALVQDPRAALPAVEVREGTEDAVWLPRRDLLACGPRDRFFTGELEDDGTLALRFGDGRHGRRPPPATGLRVRYRVGNGKAGNVGAEAVDHLVLCCGVADGDGIDGVRNPLPALGGTEPEPVEQVRQLAPLSLRRTKLRAITAADYAELAGAVTGVQRAAAQLRWTGTSEQMHVALDPFDRHGTAGPELIEAVTAALARYRRIGHRLVVGTATTVPVDLELTVCLAPGHHWGTVATALRRVLGAGRSGFFHPDALTFGEGVRVSRILTAASTVPGVAGAVVTRLKRLFRPAGRELEDGLLTVGPLEIAQLDDDPDRPENGRLAIVRGPDQPHGGAR